MKVGIDLQSITELRGKPDLLGSPAVFTAYERAYCDEKPDRATSLAGILCAKEACLKLLFGFDDLPRLTWHDVEIRHAHNGRPIVRAGQRLAGWLAARALELDVSISHSGDYAMAAAVAAAIAAPSGAPAGVG
jgi:holo-[acyl-carrier protein] synthase